MGTRSLTHIIDGYTSFYRQFDGYPDGHGKELAEFLKDFKLVNGYSDKHSNISNGMPCLALQLISHFKKGMGDFYAIAHNSSGHGEEYTYFIYADAATAELRMSVIETAWDSSTGVKLFDGTPKEYLVWINQKESSNE